MFSRFVFVVITGIIIGLTGVAHDAEAGGIILYELGTPGVGRASAGWAARAGDPATLFTNPAGMSRMSDKQFLAAGQLIYGNYKFKANNNTTVNGNDGGNAVGWLPGGSVFYTHTSGSVRAWPAAASIALVASCRPGDLK